MRSTTYENTVFRKKCSAAYENKQLPYTRQGTLPSSFVPRAFEKCLPIVLPTVSCLDGVREVQDAAMDSFFAGGYFFFVSAFSFLYCDFSFLCHFLLRFFCSLPFGATQISHCGVKHGRFSRAFQSFVRIGEMLAKMPLGVSSATSLWYS